MTVNSPQDDDWQLLSRSRRDPVALAELFHRHRDTVFRFAMARTGDEDLANDITQELFLRLAGYRRPVFRRARFSTWLYRVTANIATDEWRRKNRAHGEPLQEQAAPGTEEASADLDRVLDAMGQLPQRQREVFHLRILEQWSEEDTAATLGITIGSVKTHLHRALGAIRTQLKET
jgi:RNA polymerase sigma-70 factor (ECF subfamily)